MFVFSLYLCPGFLLLQTWEFLTNNCERLFVISFHNVANSNNEVEFTFLAFTLLWRKNPDKIHINFKNACSSLFFSLWTFRASTIFVPFLSALFFFLFLFFSFIFYNNFWRRNDPTLITKKNKNWEKVVKQNLIGSSGIFIPLWE